MACFRLFSLILCFTFIVSVAYAASFTERAHLIDPPQRMPAFVFEDADHVQHTLSDYRGHFVLLNIWAAWCGPCVQEMPSLEALQKKFSSQKLVVLPLSEDRGDAIVTSFYRTHMLTHLPVAIDNAGIAPSALKLEGLPTTFLIDPQGQAVMRFEGPTDWTSTEALAFFNNRVH